MAKRMEVATACLSKLVEILMEATKPHARYLCCFKSIVEDLKKEEEYLKLAQDRVEQQVERAARNTEEIEKDVKKWLSDVSEVIRDVEELKDVMKGAKTCLNGRCPNWGWQYRLGKKAEEKRSFMLNLRDAGKFTSVSHPATLPGIEFLKPKEFELFESAKTVFIQIIEALKDDNTNMVGLYGMGGVGKTTIAKEVGNKVLEQKIFDKVVMVVVSQNSVVHIQDQIAESLDLKLEEKIEVNRAERLYLRFSKSDKKILIILDDVWKKLDLKVTIGISSDDGQRGHKILLTTRLEQVCIAMKCQQKIQLNVLTKTEGLSLLKRYAGIGEDSPTLNDIAIDVASECKGLPLALVTIGSSLREKGIDEWKLVFRKLRKSKLEDIHNVDVDIYACLKLSYDYLKGEKTKCCFLLCSLYPEDHSIPLEELVRYGMGLGLYRDADTIDEARSELRVQVNDLKASCLLLDSDDEEFVKIHDIVRDVALIIASKEKKIMVKGGMGLTEWPNEEGMEQCTALLLMANKIYELPRDLVYPKLEILIVEEDHYGYPVRRVSDNFIFGEMKALKVISVSGWDMSLKSLQFLTNLRTLHLNVCRLRDMSYFKSLNKLEIVDFNGSSFYDFPKELEELVKLRLLAVWNCPCRNKIPSNIFPRLSRLEELYIEGNFFRESETGECSDASLSELSSLQRLAILWLDINTSCLPKNFVFSNLHSYDIMVNERHATKFGRSLLGSKHSIKYRTQRILRINDYEATLLFAFQSLYRSVESLRLNHLKGCQNIVPSIDESGFKKLNILELDSCDELQCIMDKSPLNVPATAFCNLRTIVVLECPNMCSLFPATMAQRLDKLEEVTISSCHKLQEIIRLEGLCYNPGENLALLSSLLKLNLKDIRELRFILKGPINYVSLQSLTDVEVTGCENLAYLFSLSVAQTLVQLKALTVRDCKRLEHLVKKEGDGNMGTEILSKAERRQHLFFSKLECLSIYSCARLEYILPIAVAGGLVLLEKLTVKSARQLKHIFFDNEREENPLVVTGNDIMLPKLKKLTLERLENLFNFCSGNYYSTWPSLEDLRLKECSNLTTSFVAQLDTNMQALGEKLRVLEVNNCNLCDTIVSLLRYGLKNLEELKICLCEIKVIFQLEYCAVTNGQGRKLSLPSLKKLELKNLKELETFYKGPAHNLSLQNLTWLTVSFCQKLRSIFSTSLAQILQKLEFLSIFYCSELEHIIVEDSEADRILLQDQLQPLFFPNLKSIEVRGCKKLKILFPVTIARGLQQLISIDIEYSFRLEEVFGIVHKLEADEGDNKETMLPKLNKLVLRQLPSLNNLCPVGYHFIFPSLKGFEVKGCPKITTRFSVDQSKYVHAEAEVPQIEDEDVKEQFPSKPILDFDCDGFDEIQKKLPPYKKI